MGGKPLHERWWFWVLLLWLLWWWLHRGEAKQSSSTTSSGPGPQSRPSPADMSDPAPGPVSSGAQGGYSGPTATLAAGYISDADYLAASPDVQSILNAVNYIHPTQGDMGVPLYQAWLNIFRNGSDTEDVRAQMSRRLEATA
jgi:hypothetical protein